jgi:predicted metal-dependent HD superfamily phosphohydrolase
MSTSEAEHARFEALWRRCIPSQGAVAAGDVYADLRRRLDAPNRRFHNLHHIRDCLRRFDEVASLLRDPDAVEVALWFHDAVYEPSDTDNERRSAELFLARSNGARPLFRRRVCGLILTTRHQRQARGNDRCFIDDIDLAGFGAPWEVFTQQGVLLREEFSDQDDAQYHAGQASFLERLAGRPWFFATGYFRDRYEARAQDNLVRTLALLKEQGYRSGTA